MLVTMLSARHSADTPHYSVHPSALDLPQFATRMATHIQGLASDVTATRSRARLSRSVTTQLKDHNMTSSRTLNVRRRNRCTCSNDPLTATSR
jgi:hypothetical protein